MINRRSIFNVNIVIAKSNFIPTVIQRCLSILLPFQTEVDQLSELGLAESWQGSCRPHPKTNVMAMHFDDNINNRQQQTHQTA
jgi:hypothetical protein